MMNAEVEETSQARENANKSLTARIPFFLTWGMDFDVAREAHTAYLNLLETAYLAWLNNCECVEKPLLEELYVSLKPDSRLRFLSTPGVSYSLLQLADKSQCSVDWFFNSFLLAEAMGRPTLSARVPSGAFPPPCGDLSSIQDYQPLRTVDIHGVTIDAASAFCFPPITSLDSYSDQEVELVTQRLTRVLGMLKSVNEILFSMIQQVLRMIVVRKDIENTGGFSSSSWPGLIGTIALVNAHRTDLEDVWTIDAVIHESIHSLLYIIEQFEPFYSSQSARQAFKIISPWSGKSLYLHSYIHACFVWFGLWSFWSLAIETGQFSSASAKFLRDRSCRGFLAQNLLEDIGVGQEHVSEQVRNAIKTMQEIVVRSCSQEATG